MTVASNSKSHSAALLKKGGSSSPETGLIQKVSSAIVRHSLLEKGSTVVVGVSGGPDSMVLLHVLNALKLKWQIEIVAAHLNHKTRGAESDRDQKFVERWAKRWNIPCVTDTLIAPEGKPNASWEDFWREARWTFFQSVARSCGAKTVALAHHLNDQAETVLVRILRGTGPGGLAAMRHASARAGFRIIRPLLDISCEEITEYARSSVVRYVEDSSNCLPVFLRNRVRHDLIPHIETNYQIKIQTLLTRLASVSAEEDDFIEQMTAKVWDRVLVEEAHEYIAFSLESLLGEHPVIRYRMIRKAAEKLAELRLIDFTHAQKIQDLFQGNTNGAVDLPKGIEVRRERKLIVVTRRLPDNLAGDPEALNFALHLDDSRSVERARMRITVRKLKNQPETIRSSAGERNRWREVIDGDAIEFPLQVRSRREGDRFHPLGQTKPMKLKDFLMREHFPSHRKSFWPLVISKGEIIWIPGYRLSDSVKVKLATKNFIELAVERY